MLCFDHVSFAYPGERTILNDLSFSVSEGEQVGLVFRPEDIHVMKKEGQW